MWSRWGSRERAGRERQHVLWWEKGRRALFHCRGRSAVTCPITAAAALKITEEQRLKAELEHGVEALKGRIGEQRVQMGGINNSAQQYTKVGRQTTGLGSVGFGLPMHARRARCAGP